MNTMIFLGANRKIWTLNMILIQYLIHMIIQNGLKKDEESTNIPSMSPLEDDEEEGKKGKVIKILTQTNYEADFQYY